MPTKAEKEAVAQLEQAGQSTTGHEWDGICEYDTPPPKWWLYVFYATIGIAILYFVLYPSIPGFSGYFGGLLDRQERRVFEESVARAAERQAGMRAATTGRSKPPVGSSTISPTRRRRKLAASWSRSLEAYCQAGSVPDSTQTSTLSFVTSIPATMGVTLILGPFLVMRARAATRPWQLYGFASKGAGGDPR